MFQYSFGKRVSEKFAIPLKLDISNLAERRYELGIFSLADGIATKNDMLLFDRRNAGFSKKLVYKIKSLFSMPAHFSEEEGKCFSLPAKSAKNILMTGYWQNEKYFKDSEAAIRRSFTFPCITCEANKVINERILESNSVGIHIRRGDYLLAQNAEIHGILNVEYYREAIDYMQKETKDPVFFIFSDDPEWVKGNIHINGTVYYVNGNQGREAYIDMQLMSYCRHNIIANSSFSWWAAWLNVNPNKIIVAPEDWFADRNKNELNKDIVPDKWIRL